MLILFVENNMKTDAVIKACEAIFLCFLMIFPFFRLFFIVLNF